MKILNPGLHSIVAKLLEEKETLANKYSDAIKNGEKLENIKSLYMTLMDVDRRLRDFL